METGIPEVFLVPWSSWDPPRNTGVGRRLKRGPKLSLVSLAWPMNEHLVAIGPQNRTSVSEQTCPGPHPHTMPTFGIYTLAKREGPYHESCPRPPAVGRALFTLAHCVALSEFNTSSESPHSHPVMRALTQRL